MHKKKKTLRKQSSNFNYNGEVMTERHSSKMRKDNKNEDNRSTSMSRNKNKRSTSRQNKLESKKTLDPFSITAIIPKMTSGSFYPSLKKS